MSVQEFHALYEKAVYEKVRQEILHDASVEGFKDEIATLSKELSTSIAERKQLEKKVILLRQQNHDLKVGEDVRFQENEELKKERGYLWESLEFIGDHSGICPFEEVKKLKKENENLKTHPYLEESLEEGVLQELKELKEEKTNLLEEIASCHFTQKHQAEERSEFIRQLANIKKETLELKDEVKEQFKELTEVKDNFIDPDDSYGLVEAVIEHHQWEPLFDHPDWEDIVRDSGEWQSVEEERSDLEEANDDLKKEVKKLKKELKEYENESLKSMKDQMNLSSNGMKLEEENGGLKQEIDDLKEELDLVKSDREELIVIHQAE